MAGKFLLTAEEIDMIVQGLGLVKRNRLYHRDRRPKPKSACLSTRRHKDHVMDCLLYRLINTTGEIVEQSGEASQEPEAPILRAG